MTEQTEDEKAPVFSSWNGWYRVVLITMIIQIVIYIIITESFS